MHEDRTEVVPGGSIAAREFLGVHWWVVGVLKAGGERQVSVPFSTRLDAFVEIPRQSTNINVP